MVSHYDSCVEHGDGTNDHHNQHHNDSNNSEQSGLLHHNTVGATTTAVEEEEYGMDDGQRVVGTGCTMKTTNNRRSKKDIPLRILFIVLLVIMFTKFMNGMYDSDHDLVMMTQPTSSTSTVKSRSSSSSSSTSTSWLTDITSRLTQSIQSIKVYKTYNTNNFYAGSSSTTSSMTAPNAPATSSTISSGIIISTTATPTTQPTTTPITTSPTVGPTNTYVTTTTNRGSGSGGSTSSSNSSRNSRDVIPMPDGVNFGSWLALEDYFYVGTNGAVEVATPDDKIAAVCLPPLHTGKPGPKWQSETDLLSTLTQQIGLAKALKVFHAHRTSFIDLDEDLYTLQQLGILNIRVPLSWCFTNYDPATIQATGGVNFTSVLREQFTCEDPYYNGVYWAAIPKSMIVNLLHSCSQYRIKATLDLHTYPGATSIGTFSGLWPKWAKFWTEGDHPPEDSSSSSDGTTSSTPKDVGRQLFHDFVTFIEELIINDEDALNGLRAISPMNEPAHLAGLFTANDTKSFLPSLSPQLAASFLAELNQHSYNGKTLVPDGPHLRVLLWLTDAVKTFRQSKLPSLGKELHVNIHESIFHGGIVFSTVKAPSQMALEIISSWWSSITTPDERQTWAVLDVHHYHAWDTKCQGASDGPPFGKYTCSDSVGRTETLKECTGWATNLYRPIVNEQCGYGAKLASAEFSAATHHLVKHACNDVTTLRETYVQQVNNARQSQVELFFWSYKMPYGGTFRNAWSFKHLMYLLGVLPHPDEPIYDCGQHIPTKDEPIDPIFDTLH